jgi:hypothetical protein
LYGGCGLLMVDVVCIRTEQTSCMHAAPVTVAVLPCASVIT